MSSNCGRQLFDILSLLCSVDSLTRAAETLKVDPRNSFFQAEFIRKWGYLFDLIDTVEELVVQKANAPEHEELYRRKLGEIRQAVCSVDLEFSLDRNPMSSSGFKLTISQDKFDFLLNMSFMMDSNPEQDEDDIDEIRDIIQQLQDTVRDNKEIPRQFRSWLLDVIRTMRDAVDRYEISGGRGLKKEFQVLVGQLYTKWAAPEVVKNDIQKHSSTWSLVLNYASRIYCIVSKYESFERGANRIGEVVTGLLD